MPSKFSEIFIILSCDKDLKNNGNVIRKKQNWLYVIIALQLFLVRKTDLKVSAWK